jgi:hypothetical protein
MRLCESEGCTNEAKWHPFIICRNEAGETVLEGDTHTLVCDDHKESASVDDFMDDGQYKTLCKTFDAMKPKKKHPPRELMVLEFGDLPPLGTASAKQREAAGEIGKKALPNGLKML